MATATPQSTATTTVGTALFRFRSFTPVPIIAAVGWLLWRSRGAPGPGGPAVDAWLNALGLAVAAAGQALRFYTLSLVREGSSGQGAVLESTHLNTQGPYAHVRNPLYLGNLGIVLGLLLIAHEPWAYAVTLGFFFGEYHFIIRAEERFLLERQVPEPRDPRTHVPKQDGFLVRDEAKYPRRFQSFHQHLFHPLFQREYPLDPREQALTAFFPEHGLQFIGLNSACEIDEQFPGRARVNEAALSRALARARQELHQAKPGTPITRVAVWHHPVTELEDAAFVEQLRKADVRLCLHGHVHEERAELLAHTDPVRKLYTVGAGSFGAVAKHRPESTPRLYNLIEIDPGHQWTQIHTRARPRSGGAWGPWTVWPSDAPNERRAHYQIDLPSPLVVGQAP